MHLMDQPFLVQCAGSCSGAESSVLCWSRVCPHLGFGVFLGQLALLLQHGSSHQGMSLGPPLTAQVCPAPSLVHPPACAQGLKALKILLQTGTIQMSQKHRG